MGKVKVHFRNFALAEDDTDDAELFAEALAEVAPAIRCNQAANGKILLDKIDSGEFELPDIIFLDVNMPEMNGWTCLTELRKRSDLKTIPVIMYSTSSHLKDKKAAENLGANFFYTKPDSFQQLKAFLLGLIENPKAFHIDN